MKVAGQSAIAISAQRAFESTRLHDQPKGTGMAKGAGRLGLERLGLERLGFERLMKQHLQPATRLALRLTNKLDQADDLVQETMLRALRSWTTYGGRSKFNTWLYGIMINVFRDQLKKQKRNREVNTDSLGDEYVLAAGADVSATAAVEANELAEVVADMIARLPTRQREVLVLSTYQNLSHEEISETVGISLANVYSTLSAARKKLKHQLAPYID